MCLPGAPYGSGLIAAAPDPTRVLLRSFTPGDVPRLAGANIYGYRHNVNSSWQSRKSRQSQTWWITWGTGRSSRSMESRVTESTAALVRKRVKVATSGLQMTRIYQTRDHVENSLAGLWIVSPSFEERVQIEQLAAHLDEYLQYSKRQLVHS
jgi:hypothetical protein